MLLVSELRCSSYMDPAGLQEAIQFIQQNKDKDAVIYTASILSDIRSLEL